jgi:hypothetical protein
MPVTIHRSWDDKIKDFGRDFQTASFTAWQRRGDICKNFLYDHGYRAFYGHSGRGRYRFLKLNEYTGNVDRYCY